MYQEKEKIKVRKLMLESAIKDLTSNRESSYILSKNDIFDLYKRSYKHLIDIFDEVRESIYHMDSYRYTIEFIEYIESFCGGKPDTLKPILEILLRNKLTPLSVVLTNFSEVKEKIDYHAGIIDSYFIGRYNDYPSVAWKFGKNFDPEIFAFEGIWLKNIVAGNIDIFYSDYITRFIIDLARFIIPNAKAVSFNNFWEQMLN